MDLRLLDRLVLVAELGSLNKAAQALHLSQPALSKSIQLLEERYGVALLDRGPGGVRLTSFGQALFRHAKRIAADARRMDSEIEALRSLQAGTVHLGVPMGPGYVSRILAVATLRLLGEGRRLAVNHTAGARSGLLRLLHLGELDFAVTVLLDDGLAEDLVEEELYVDRAALVVGARHPLAAAGPADLPAVLRHPWIVLEENAPAEHRLRRLARDAGLEVGSSVLRSASSLFIKAILTRSDCVGLVRLDTVRVELEENELVELLLAPDLLAADLLPRHRMGLVRRRDNAPSPASHALIEAIRAECAALPSSERPPSERSVAGVAVDHHLRAERGG